MKCLGSWLIFFFFNGPMRAWARAAGGEPARNLVSCAHGRHKSSERKLNCESRRAKLGDERF